MKDGLLRGLVLGMALLCTAARCVQLFLFFDAESGFTTDGGWLSALVVVLAGLSLLLPVWRVDGRELVLPEGRRVLCGLAALLGGLAMLAGAVFAVLAGPPVSSAMLFSLLTRGTYVACVATTALGGIALCWLGVCHLLGRAPFAGCRWLCLLPVLTVGVRALYLFAVYSPEDLAFSNLLNWGALVLLLCFFTRLGRAFTAEEVPESLPPELLVFAAGAAAVGLACSAPNLLCLALGRACVRSADTAHQLTVLGMALYALAFALSLCIRQRRRRFGPRRENAPLPEEHIAQDLPENV